MIETIELENFLSYRRATLKFGRLVALGGPNAYGGATPARVCLSVPKYEEWIVASAKTIGRPELAYDSTKGPEFLIRSSMDAKYVKPTFQPRFTARIDIELAVTRSRSLERSLARFDELRSLIL
jgi:hypothetical protein